MLFCSIYWAQFLQMLQVVLKSFAQRLLMSEVVSLLISNILLLSYSLTANGPVLVRLETKTGFMQFLLQHVSLLHRFLSNYIYRQCIICRQKWKPPRFSCPKSCHTWVFLSLCRCNSVIRWVLGRKQNLKKKQEVLQRQTWKTGAIPFLKQWHVQRSQQPFSSNMLWV